MNAAKFVHTRRALSSTITNFHQETVSGQACNPFVPRWSFSYSFAEELSYGTRHQSGSLSLINVGSFTRCDESRYFPYIF